MIELDTSPLPPLLTVCSPLSSAQAAELEEKRQAIAAEAAAKLAAERAVAERQQAAQRER